MVAKDQGRSGEGKEVDVSIKGNVRDLCAGKYSG